MKTIHHKIFLPFLVIIICLPLLVFIIYNVAIHYQSVEWTKTDLTQTLETMQVLIKEELMDMNVNPRENYQEALGQTLTAFNRAMRMTSKTQGTEIFFVSSNGKFVFPKDTSDYQVDLEAINALLDQKDDLPLDQAFQHEIKDQTYLVQMSQVKVPSLRQQDSTFIVLAPLNQGTPFSDQLTLILAAIISAAILLASIVARRISKGLAKPIQVASDYAGSIASGQYQTIQSPSKTKEIVHLYDSLNQMSDHLKEAQEAQVSYFQNVSHDLRTPLMSIQGYAEGIQAGIFEDVHQAAGIIRDESLRLKNFVDQLLTLSKLEHSYQHQDKESFNIKDIMDTIVMRYQGFSQSQNITISMNAPEDYTLYMDLSLFDKIISNILSNAIKYADHIVIIDVVKIEKKTRITIQDDGPGISKEDDQKLLERFHKGNQGNFGLGLAIVDSALKLVGGKITWKNHDQGALFILEFD